VTYNAVELIQGEANGKQKVSLPRRYIVPKLAQCWIG